MEAHAAPRRQTGTRRWRRALEDRRVLAPLLIAPSVIFMVLVVGIPFVWAIYLSMTDAIGGSATARSQLIFNSFPPPTTIPFNRAIIGFPTFLITS